MNTQVLKKIVLVCSTVLINSFAIAAEGGHTSKKDTLPKQENSAWDVENKAADMTEATTSDHHTFVHPFLAHMGMPDGPGEVSARVMSVEARNAGVAEGTYGFHIEAGIIDNLGLHLRNDAVKTHSKTEMMLQYAVIKSADGLSGVSLVAEIEFPTGSTASNRIEGLYGISFAYVWAPILAVNSVVHYNQDKKEVEWEIAFVGRLTEKIFPILEFSGENSQDMSLATALFAWKFKIASGNSLAVAYRVPITTPRDFDSQLMLQAEFNFH